MKPGRASFLLLGTLAQGLNIPPVPTLKYEPIKTGYVAFGDSYAAGPGAGPTGRGGCRIGALSYPSQLNAWVQSLVPGVDYQNLPCSGAVITDVLQGGDKSQIDNWVNPSKANRATLSIGGNDIGFYNVLDSCVIRLEQFWSGSCDKYVNDAYSIMTGAGFMNNLDSALRQIIEKSGRSDFKIIQTGYPTFFNDQTDSCDYTTFYFWQPGHHAIHHLGNWAYLEKPLRSKLNRLVTDLNTQLQVVINNVNKDFDTPRVVFADPNPAFTGHRFCEEGIEEPDPRNLDNWMFLASWPDDSLPGTVTGADSNITEAVERALHDWTVPDAATCASTHGWSDLTLCGMAKAGLASNVDGKLVMAPTVKLPNGTDISTSEIPWLYPTAWVKTFHPRTLGHLAYRDLVIKNL